MAEWISYESADSPPAEVSIDVDLATDQAFRNAHPYALTVTVRGFRAERDGLPSDEVSEALYAIESRIESALDSNDAALACTVSGEGAFTLIGYARTSAIDALVREAIGSTRFNVAIDVTSDASWSSYENYALTGDELEEARDAEQLDQLEDAGDNLSLKREVDFAVSFNDAKNAARASAALRETGFVVPPAEFLDGATAYDVSRTMALSPELLDAQRKAIVTTIEPFGGTYRGWSADIADGAEALS